MAVKFSVVISTHDRSTVLLDCLRSLELQDYPHFEVIVVVGPCTDETEALLDRHYRGKIKLAHCPDKNLSISRNIGIEAASGDVIAFIDDDSVASRTWLSKLAEAYSSPGVAGAGGIVFDHTGRSLQYRYSTCTRYGRASFPDEPPPVRATEKGADPFVYLQGTNASFRRSALVAIGGFNEQIAYYHDETDVCLRIIDRVGKLIALDGAAVHHRYAASDKRDHRRIVFHPQQIVRSQHIFALQNAAPYHNADHIYFSLESHTRDIENGGIHHTREGDLSSDEGKSYLQEVEQGVAEGLAAGTEGRMNRAFDEASSDAFLPFVRRVPPGKKLRIAFVSEEYPPDDYGGIGRFTFDLAHGFAAQGHDTHVITHVDGPDRTDFEDGVWVHRLSKGRPMPESAAGDLLQHNLRHLGSVYREVDRLHREANLDVVSAPIWNSEGALVACDSRFPTVVTLMTPMRVVADMLPSWADNKHIGQMLRLEEATFKQHKHAHAISQGILDRMTSLYGDVPDAAVVPLGVRDLSGQVQRVRQGGPVRVLFVGRMEVRKGVNTLLEAAIELIEEDDVEFYLVGKDTPNTGLDGRTYREMFEARQDIDERVRSRIHFVGAVSEQELTQHYADADILCLPSRYESFGLVLIEGAVFGMPLVAANVGGMREIVEHEKNGLLFEVGDVRNLAAAIRRLLHDRSERERLGKQARADFERKFSLDVVIPATVEFYSRIAASNTGETEGTKEETAKNFERLLAGAALVEGKREHVARELVGLPSAAEERPRRSIRSRIRDLVHQIYHRIHRIPVLGGVAYEAARAYKTYRAVQRAFLDQALPDHLFAVHDHVSHVRNLAEKQARADARMRYEVRLEQQQRGREIQELASAPQLNEEIAGLHKRLEFVRNELMFELREATGSSPGGAHEVQPQLKDESIRDRAEKRLNVGCGHIPLEGYINVDRRDLPGVDIVAEASGIPLEDGTVDEIFSSHLLEHFPVETLRRRVLPHWHALLRPGGVIGAIVPDAEAMFEGYQNETVSFDDLRTVTYGLQEYEGDFHFNMFSRGSLTQAFEEAGFEKPQFVFTARRNGMCFDMHIRATKCMSERAQPAEKLDAAQ